MIFIAKDYKGRILSIVSAKSEEAVRAYYQGKGLQYDSIKEFKIEEDRENEKMGFVTPILETKTLSLRDPDRPGPYFKDYIVLQ